VRIGNLSGKRFSALITDMDQPLGNYIGNALEVEEAIDVLAGRTQGALKDVSLELGAHILRNAGVAKTVAEGVDMLDEKIRNGDGLRKLAEMIRAQGGDPRVTEDTSLLPKAKSFVDIKAPEDGYLTGIVTSVVGDAARLLGAGRAQKTDEIDPAVGIVMKKRVGDPVKRGETVCTLHVGDRSDKVGAYNLMLSALKFGREPVEPPKLIHAVVE
ncbi:MAG: pyrimidine-nucleoside phosphorylase, partial [Clostridiales bacterium]|nr:pyrimidine-nucleoside phosphorylase [Clostridiales bacterium]